MLKKGSHVSMNGNEMFRNQKFDKLILEKIRIKDAI